MPFEPPPALIDRRLFLGRGALAFLGCLLAPRLWAAAGTEGAVHIVRRGDTLSGIAGARGSTVARLKQANGLTSDRIRIGQRLTIPGADPVLDPVVAATRGLALPAGRWTMIVAHHSAIAQGNAASYDRTHRERGMENGLAYHFLIGNGTGSGDGQIEVGSRWLKQLDGGHVRSERINRLGIGICCVGNFEKTPPTPRQIASFEALVHYLRGDLRQGRERLVGHREIEGAQTLCPGRHFPISTLRRRLAV
jgi:LysM repeat protein